MVTLDVSWSGPEDGIAPVAAGIQKDVRAPLQTYSIRNNIKARITSAVAAEYQLS